MLERHQSLYQFGGDLQEAHSRNPYSPETIDIRGAGDFHAAQSLRSALDLANRGRFDEAIALCQEAAELAPGYHEVQRIQGFIYEISLSYSEAFDAYDRARDLAEKSPFVRYFYGKFLVNSGYNPGLGLTELQRAARLDPDSSEVKIAVAEAHSQLGNFVDALEVANAVINGSSAGDSVCREAMSLAISVSVKGADRARGKSDWPKVAELVESTLASLGTVSKESLTVFDLDKLMLLGEACLAGASGSGDDYVARRCRDFADELLGIRRHRSPSHIDRRIGHIKHMNIEKGFAFIISNGERYFLHASQLLQREFFDSLSANSLVAFTPGPAPNEGQNPRALSADWLD
ncbi:MAG: tetratricopeptide repeat protein [Rhodococcus sp. (in: high G+C Gram-positive bacteria)]|nr:MAG: tetratricopeptide repeat protein [Rhodococcus sp. (in: high G+C Gram-positive bacteria)]